MNKILLFVTAFWAIGATVACGQQDPMFTKYVFNSLIFNPAYAGSNEHLTAHLIHRQQWIGFDGNAPVTQSVSIHSPLRNDRVGVGLSLVNDKTGVSGTFDASAAYSYRFSLNATLKLSIGLQAGVTNWRGNWTKLKLENPGDDAFENDINRWLPNFGAGIYLHSEKFYVGIGSPRLLEHDLRKIETSGTTIAARTYRHYYTSAGVVIPTGNPNIVFRPTVLLKTTGWFSNLRKGSDDYRIGAPAQLDIDLSFGFFQSLWIGAAYRTGVGVNTSGESADLWAAYYLRNGLRLGMAYDIVVNNIRTVSSGGSLEVMLGYEFDIKVKKVQPPQYF